MKEFMGLVEECMKTREDLTRLLSKARRNLEIAGAMEGEALTSLAVKSERNITLDIKIKNVWGVKIPEIVERPVVRSLEARDVSPIGESPFALGTARDFEMAVSLMIKMAGPEARLARVGEMIKSDSRKINAIGEVMLPDMKTRIKAIERVLEEREKEEIYRIKRYKSVKATQMQS